jgi:hypothetical protein
MWCKWVTVLFWAYSGPILVLFWSYSGPILVLFWSCSGPIAPWRPTWNVMQKSNDCPVLFVLILLLHDSPLEMWCKWVTVLFWAYSGLVLVLLLHDGSRNVIQMSDCPILSLFWSCSGPIAPWRLTECNTNEWLSYSKPILVLFWSYSGSILVLFWSCSGPIAPWRPTWNVMQISDDCPVLFVLILLLHDSPLEMWCKWVTVLFWAYSGLVLVLLLHDGSRNVIQMSDCPILSLFWSCSGPIAPWRLTECNTNEWLSYSKPILVLFWSYSGPILVLFWSCSGPIAPWRPTWNVMQIRDDCPILLVLVILLHDSPL